MAQLEAKTTSDLTRVARLLAARTTCGWSQQIRHVTDPTLSRESCDWKFYDTAARIESPAKRRRAIPTRRSHPRDAHGSPRTLPQLLIQGRWCGVDGSWETTRKDPRKGFFEVREMSQNRNSRADQPRACVLSSNRTRLRAPLRTINTREREREREREVRMRKEKGKETIGKLCSVSWRFKLERQGSSSSDFYYRIHHVRAFSRYYAIRDALSRSRHRRDGCRGFWSRERKASEGILK